MISIVALISLLSFSIPQAVSAETLTIPLPESMLQTRSHTITLPPNAYMKKVTTNTGNVSYSRDGNQLTLTASNGNPSRSEWNDKKYSKPIFKTETSSYNSFPSSYPYSDGQGYSGIYTKSGGSYHYSGEVVPSHTINVSTYQQTGTGGSASSLPPSISYNSGGYVGTMYGQGVSLVSGSEGDSKWFSQTKDGYPHGSIPSSIEYSGAGYRGTLYQNGSPQVTSGYAADSTSTAWSTSENYTPMGYAVLSAMSGSQSFSQCNYTPNYSGYSSLTGCYSGTLGSSYGPYVHEYSPTSKVWRRVWFGGVSRAESRVYRQQFAGTITKASTAVYGQSYSGTATKPGYNTYLYGQDYSGTAYLGGVDHYYSYNLTVEYVIDTELPDGILTANPTNFTNNDVTITLSEIKDFGDSGINGVILPNGTFTSGEVIPYTVGTNGTYHFIIEDNAGNRKTKSINIVNIDKVSPTANLTASPTSFTNENVTLTLSNISDSGVSGLKQIVLPDGKTETTFENKQFEVTENGTYTFRVHDNAGNITTRSITVSNIDKFAPTANLTQNPTTWTNGNVTLSLTNIQDLGVSGLKNVTLPNGNKVAPTNVNYDVSLNGAYHFDIEDNAGNKTRKTITVSNIDKTLPTANLTASTTGYTKQDVVLNLTSISDNGGSGLKSVKTPNGAVSNTFSNIAYPVQSNGLYQFEIQDHAGNKTVKNIEVSNIDKENPDFTIDYSPKQLNKGPVTITLSNVKDNGVSGVKSLTSNISLELPAQPSYSFQVSENGTYQFVLSDKAGNTTRKDVNIENIDNKPPFALYYWERGWTNKDVTIHFTDFQDDGVAGYKSMKLPNGIVVTGSTAQFTVSKNGSYVFELEDNVGNIRNITLNVENIDKVNPTIELSEKELTKQSIKAVIKIRDANTRK